MEIRVQGKGAGQKFGGGGKAGSRTKRWEKEMPAQNAGDRQQEGAWGRGMDAVTERSRRQQPEQSQ